jgi:hypothetical protein
MLFRVVQIVFIDPLNLSQFWGRGSRKDAKKGSGEVRSEK